MKNMKRLGVVALFFILLLAESFTSVAQSDADKQKIVADRYAGRYRGEWVVTSQTYHNNAGTWTLVIEPQGETRGREKDYTTGRTADLSGFINEDGAIDILCEYPKSISKYKGTIIKTRSGHLKGTLTQYIG